MWGDTMKIPDYIAIGVLIVCSCGLSQISFRAASCSPHSLDGDGGWADNVWASLGTKQSQECVPPRLVEVGEPSFVAATLNPPRLIAGEQAFNALKRQRDL